MFLVFLLLKTRPKDGTQAARSSDYAIREFQHLKKLIAVHGRWNYVRNSTIVQYWCYKNTAFIFVLFWFGLDCGWSGQNYYDSWIITLFNVFFTALPPLFFAFAEQDMSPATAYRYPQLYHECQEGRNFTILSLSLWILEALYVSVICYFFSWAVFRFIVDGVVVMFLTFPLGTATTCLETEWRWILPLKATWFQSSQSRLSICE
jgi:magnesium-transporting ATPase (P-type)